ANSRADVLMVMQCGYTAGRNAADFRALKIDELFPDLPAVRAGRMFAADANGDFSRPGPRLADGVALLAGVLHPDLFPGEVAASAIRRL
ncbi:MAG: BtuF-related (seleno)protein, partial [Candidatus Acidiferrales bacterium]